MLKFLLGSVILSLITTVLIGGVLGFVPGVSTLMGASPKNLGQNVTREDSLAAQSKASVEIIALPSGTTDKDGYIPQGTKNLDTTFSSKEITALLNNRTWKNFPAKNVQVKINPDGSLESSGLLIVSRALPFAEGLGYSAEEVKQAMTKYKLPSVEIPYYISGFGEVKNNDISLSISSLKIGAIPLPQSMTGPLAEEATAFLESLINRYQDNFSAESITSQNGQINFKGRVAEKISVVSE